jgi:hypothetical protein
MAISGLIATPWKPAAIAQATMTQGDVKRKGKDLSRNQSVLTVEENTQPGVLIALQERQHISNSKQPETADRIYIEKQGCRS